ncbi:MAG TPA: hypothetical protein VM581_00385 [Magnetospirillaceae bacterium]|nr:hypothetical protein [Magnetospirillaceae bacterium]
MYDYDTPLSPDPAEDWRLRKEQDGYKPYRDFGPSTTPIPLRKDTFAQLEGVTVWIGPRRHYAVRLVGNQYHADGVHLCEYRSEMLYGGWFRFRRAAQKWGYTLPFWWWQSWPGQPASE